MATVRTFLAIEVSPPVAESAAQVIRALSGADGPTVRWVEPKHMHITLKFFGDIAVEMTSDICRLAQDVVQTFEPFEFEVSGVGAFPSVDRPRTIWAGVTDGSKTFCRLAQDLELALEPLGFPRQRRRFQPHLTLGRVKGTGRMNPLTTRIEQNQAVQFGATTTDEVLLLSSELARSGPRYERMATLALLSST